MSTPSERNPHAVIYVTRDIERALGIEPGRNAFGKFGEYFIITNDGIYAREIHNKHPEHVFLISNSDNSEKKLLDTYELLAHPETEKIVTSMSHILVFKNTPRIEALCKERKWQLLNPSAELSEKIENKISQVEWLGEEKKYLPGHMVGKIADIYARAGSDEKFKNSSFVIQWAHGHTGEGTVFISNNEKGRTKLRELSETFPDRLARATLYIAGPMCTVNICVTPKQICIGNISYQITGMLPFTDNPFATVGNDWSLPHSILTEEHIAAFHEIAEKVGRKMQQSGWKGLFGIDCIHDIERDRLHLIEINARQPASTTYESELQQKFRDLDAGLQSGMTMFEIHLAALLDENAEKKVEKNADLKSALPAQIKCVEINDGAQIIDRIKHIPEDKNKSENKIKNKDENKDENKNSVAEELRQKKYTVIEYDNVKAGSESLRIQSLRGIMETDNKFNPRGKEILDIIIGQQ